MLSVVFGALVIGLSLGLLGSGGSILTVPVLLYLVGMPPDLAIASSLLVVFGISLFSGLIKMQRRQVSWYHVMLFGLPGMAGTVIGATLGHLSSSHVQLTVFVLLMLAAAVLMWRSRVPDAAVAHGSAKPLPLLANGVVVGVITGFVGVGGGFLIVPALVLLARLPLALATGTSLTIIAMNSAAGFAKYLQSMSASAFDWQVIAIMIGGGIAGSIVGIWAGERIPRELMRKGFAVFLVLVAGVIFSQSVL